MDLAPRPTREQYRRQVRVADEVLRHVVATGAPSLPWRQVPALATAFPGTGAVLTHLAARWSRDLAGSLDPVLDLPDAERERAAARIAGQVAARRPGLHAVLLRHAAHPAVRAAHETDRARAGLRDAPVHAEHLDPSTGAPSRRPDRGTVTALLARCPVRRALHPAGSRARAA